MGVSFKRFVVLDFDDETVSGWALSVNPFLAKISTKKVVSR